MKVNLLSNHLFYLQPNNVRVRSHPTQPVVAQDSKHADFQHQVSRNRNSKYVTNQNYRFCMFLNSDICDHPAALLVPADGDICAYRRRLIVLHPGR